MTETLTLLLLDGDILTIPREHIMAVARQEDPAALYLVSGNWLEVQETGEQVCA